MTDANSSYAAAGVDTRAGDLAVELMKEAVAKTHGPNVLGGVGGFAGLFDASALAKFKRPLLATSADGVGTKVAIASSGLHSNGFSLVRHILSGAGIDYADAAACLLYTSPSPRDLSTSRMPSSA